MITKILFTLLVIVGTIVFFSKQREAEVRRSMQKPAELSENQKLFRQGAYLFLGFMVLSAIVMLTFEIGERYETVKVHVINTQTGNRQTYQAQQQDIKSNRFTTVEGRVVYVADIERVEIEPE